MAWSKLLESSLSGHRTENHAAVQHHLTQVTIFVCTCVHRHGHGALAQAKPSQIPDSLI